MFRFVELDRLTRRKAEVVRTRQAEERLLDSLRSPTGPILLVSGELHPGTYNRTGIPSAVLEALQNDRQPTTLCWGPVTFVATNAAIPNDLSDVLEQSLGAPRLNLLHARQRQECHFWLVGDELFYQLPHRYGATTEERSCFYSRVPGDRVREYVSRTLSRDANTSIVQVAADREEFQRQFRIVEVELDVDGLVARFSRPAAPEHGIEFYLTWAKNLPSVEAVQSRTESDSIRITTYVTRQSAMSRLERFGRWTTDRFPELHLKYRAHRVPVKLIDRIRCAQSTVFARNRSAPGTE